ncbi:MAG: hypothetical protein AAF194_07315 [Pseudomonadota bacterium]
MQHPDILGGFVPLISIPEACASPLSGKKNLSPQYFEQLLPEVIVRFEGTRGDRGRKLVVLPLLTERILDRIRDQLGENAAEKSVVPLAAMPDYIAMTKAEVERLQGGKHEA